MATKLTLRLDEKLIDRAKEYAKRSDKSVSKLVADFFAVLSTNLEDETDKTTPKVKFLRGILRDYNIGPDDYKKHLEKKHL